MDDGITMVKQDFGLIGVGVMGQNLTLNIERHGHSMAVYDRDTKKVAEFLAGKAKGKKIVGAGNTEEFVALPVRAAAHRRPGQRRETRG